MNKILKARGFSWFKSKCPNNLGDTITCCWLRWRDVAQKNQLDYHECQMNRPANKMWEIKCFDLWGESRSGKSKILERKKQNNLPHIPCL